MYEDTTKVRVVECHDTSKWYNDRIGEVFDVCYWGMEEVYVKTGDSYNTGNFINAHDLEIAK